jgi:hypothetical protein
MTSSLRKLLATTIIFFSVSSFCVAAADETFFCISGADESQKILTINNNQQGKIGSTRFDLNESNQVLVGPSKDGKIFLKLEAKKLELISASGVWKGKCHKVQGTDADAITSTTIKKPETCVDNVALCTKQQLCAKGVRKVNGKKQWDTRAKYYKYYSQARKLGLSCGINENTTSSSSSSSSSSANQIKLNCERTTHSFIGFHDAGARDSWFPQSIQIRYASGSKAAKINEKGYEPDNYDLATKGNRIVFKTSAAEISGGINTGTGQVFEKRFTLLKNKTLLAQFPTDSRVNLRYSCK